MAPKKPFGRGEEFFPEPDSEAPNIEPIFKESVQQYGDLIVQAQNKTGEEGLKLFATAERLVRQFDLERDGTTAKDLIQEAAIRGIRHLQCGKAMPVPAGWFNKAIFNIAREKVRQAKKQSDLNKQQSDLEELRYRLGESDENDEALIGGKPFGVLKGILKQSWRKLSVRERRLLYYKYVYGWTWERISDELEMRGEPMQKPDALRQQGCRLIKRLRNEILIQLSVNAPVESKD